MGSLKHVALVSAVFIAAVFLPLMLALAVLVPLRSLLARAASVLGPTWA